MTCALVDPAVTYPFRGFNMVREGFAQVPQYLLPAGYVFRVYRDGDDQEWTRLHKAADPFIDIKDELFEDQYGAHRDALPDRMWFVDTDDDTTVASISAWWETGPHVANDRGRIHWVVVHPDHQRRGLSKPMMTKAMARLAQSHSATILGTSSGRPWAVKVYLDFGFLPDGDQLADPQILQAWQDVQSVINHPVLAAFLAEG